MLGNVHLEVIVLVLSLVLQGPEFFFKLAGVALGKSQAKKCESEFLVRGTEIAGLVKLVDTGLGRGVLRDDLFLSIAHRRVMQILGGVQVMQILE